MGFNDFSHFKPKRNNSIFSFRDDKITFSSNNIFIEGVDGKVDQQLLFAKLIKASHFKEKKNSEAPINPLLTIDNDISEKVIKDFYYKDYILKPTKWVIPDASGINSSDSDATSVDPSLVSGPPQKGIDFFRVVFNRRTGGDIYVRPSFSAKIDVPNERAVYTLKFPYTEEGVEESQPEDGLDPFLPTYTAAEFDVDEGDFKPMTRATKSLALYIESEYFIKYLSFASSIFVKEGRKNESFLNRRYDYFSYLYGLAYERNKLASVSQDDLTLLRNFYRIIPEGCYRDISDQQLAFDLGKFLTSDKDSWFRDESSVMVDILKNANDMSNVYKTLYNNGSYVRELYDYISDDKEHQEFLGFLRLLALMFQDPLEVESLQVIPVGTNEFVNLFVHAYPNYEDAPTEDNTEDKILIQLGRITKVDEDGNVVSSDSDQAERFNTEIILNQYFNPLQLVILEDIETGKRDILCAIEVQHYAEKEAFKTLISALVIVVNLVSIFISVGIIARGAALLVRLAALLDIGVSVTDILLQNKDFEQYMRESGELGEWMVDNWTTLSLITGSATISLDLVSKFARNADEIIDIVKNAPESKFSKESIDDVVEEMNVLKKKADEILESSTGQSKEVRKFGRIFRVQGGDGANTSKFRFIIKNKKVEIIGDDMLHVTFDDTFRTAQFWTKRGKNAEVFTAEIESSFIEKIRRDAVKQNRAKEFPDRPQIDDPTLTNSSFGIPNNYFDELIESIKNPTIIKD